MAEKMETTVSISAPGPRFQKGTVSALNMASSPEQRSLLLELGYVVALLVAFFVGIGLVIYFVRAGKAATNMLPDPIPAKEPE